jgi:hypothetical protein
MKVASQSMNPKLILCLALVLSAHGGSIDFRVTPKSLDQDKFVFSVSANSTQNGTSFHVTITAKTGVIPSDSTVGLSVLATSEKGARSMGPVKPETQVTLKKADHTWEAEFIASKQLLKDPDVCLVFGVVAHVTKNGKSIPMSSADFYVVKLRDFLRQ